MTRIATVLFLLVLTSCASMTSFTNSGFMPGTGTDIIIEQKYVNDPSNKFSYTIAKESEDIYVSPYQMTIFKSAFDASLKENNIYKEDSEKKIDIVFTNYFMRGDTERHMLGIMAGVDNISTTVFIRDSTNNKPIGKIIVVSKNASGWGTTESLIRQHAQKISLYIRGEARE